MVKLIGETKATRLPQKSVKNFILLQRQDLHILLCNRYSPAKRHKSENSLLANLGQRRSNSKGQATCKTGMQSYPQIIPNKCFEEHEAVSNANNKTQRPSASSSRYTEQIGMDRFLPSKFQAPPRTNSKSCLTDNGIIASRWYCTPFLRSYPHTTLPLPKNAKYNLLHASAVARIPC